jgi:hypothetical protein
MNRLRYSLSIILIVLSLLSGFGQNNANSILHEVYAKMQKAKDYTVQATIKIDMPLIKIIPAEVTIFYKQKDKFKVESKSITLVPRQGFDQVGKIIGDTTSFTAMIQGTDIIGTTQTNVINVIPLSDTSDLILGKLWIDAKQNVILKSQLTTRSSGTITTEFTYGKQIAYGLPDQMIFSVDASKFKMPKNFGGEPDKGASDKQTKDNSNKKGKIFIALSNYQINKGISDSVFK